jgi:hypothetical protein
LGPFRAGFAVSAATASILYLRLGPRESWRTTMLMTAGLTAFVALLEWQIAG